MSKSLQNFILLLSAFLFSFAQATEKEFVHSDFFVSQIDLANIPWFQVFCDNPKNFDAQWEEAKGFHYLSFSFYDSSCEKVLSDRRDLKGVRFLHSQVDPAHGLAMTNSQLEVIEMEYHNSWEYTNMIVNLRCLNNHSDTLKYLSIIGMKIYNYSTIAECQNLEVVVFDEIQPVVHGSDLTVDDCIVSAFPENDDMSESAISHPSLKSFTIGPLFGFSNISTFLAIHRELTFLKVEFSTDVMGTDSFVSDFIETIVTHKHLQKLSIIIPNSQFLLLFLKALPRNSSITHLYLDNLNIDEITSKALSGFLMTPSNVSHLGLNIYGHENVKSPFMVKVDSCIKHLSLDHWPIDIMPRGLHQFASLELLNVVNSKCISALSSALRVKSCNIEQLRLDLSFDIHYFEDEYIEMTMALQNLRNIWNESGRDASKFIVTSNIEI